MFSICLVERCIQLSVQETSSECSSMPVFMFFAIILVADPCADYWPKTERY